MNNENTGAEYGLKIGRRTFIGTLVLLLAIMIFVGILTYVIPQGAYQYELVDGRSVIIPDSYAASAEKAPVPVWRWLTAPFEVLGTAKGITAATIIVFILLVGGSFLVLEKSGILSHIMYGVITRYENQKYRLLTVMVFVCMFLGSGIGMFEETVTLVPICVALSLILGWDSLVGIGMSVLSVGFGFAAGMFNPFTVGIVQQLAGLPAFSGILFRAVFFLTAFFLVWLFLSRYAHKIEKNPELSMMYERDFALRERYKESLKEVNTDDPGKKRGSRIFIGALLMVLAYVIAGLFVSALSDYSMPVMAIGFTVGSIFAGRSAGLKKGIGKVFLNGVLSIAPSVLLILLAMGVTHIMEQGGIIDTILNFFYLKVEALGPYGGVIALLFLVLLVEFFISSSTAKAFLLIPIIIPLADMIGITRQTAAQALILGDGFTNMIYPTNVVLLIILGIVGVPYARWFKWTWKIQLALLGLSVISLIIAVGIGYGPY